PAGAWILEHFAPGVEHEALHAGAALVRYFLEHDLAAGERRTGIGGGPKARAVLGAEVVLARLERLERDVGVAEILVAHLVEVVAAPVERELGAPIVLGALTHDRAPRIDPGDPVRTAAERRLECRAVELALFVIVLGQDRHLAGYQRQLAIHGAVEHHAHPALALGNRLDDVGIIGAI